MTPDVETVAGLRSLYREPAQRSLDKEVDHLDRHCRDFIAHASMVMVATADSDGRCDVSPRGGPPGFVAVLDDHRLSLPDLAGNNRLDSLSNLVSSPGIGLLFLVPGIDETLRVNGVATVTTDPETLAASSVDGMAPHVALVTEVETAFLHCAKALRRARMWQPEAWPEASGMATPACMLRDQMGLSLSVEESQAYLDESYTRTMWEVGGEKRA